jgi:hypothetical protein
LIPDAAKYGKRGRKALTNQYRYNVEGEQLTTQQIADRSGRSLRSVQKIIKKREPLTWERLTLSK